MTVRTRGLPALVLAAVLAVAACGEAQDDGPESVSRTGDAATVGVAEPSDAPAPGAPMTVEDSIAVREDSLYELRILRQRQASMATYADCMESAKGLGQPQRRTIEAACARSRGNSPP